MTTLTARPASSIAPATVALLGGAVAMGISPIFVRLADVGPFALAFWRLSLALPVLWLWMRAGEANASPATPVRRFSWPTILAGLCFAGDLSFWHLSVLRTSVANATFLATMTPLWVVLFGWLFFRKVVSRGVMLGLALCIAGGCALVAQSLGFSPSHGWGDAFGIATGLCFGLYILAIEVARGSASGARVTFEMTVVAAIALLVIATILESRLLPVTPTGWAVLFAISWISHAGGQGLLSVALGRLPVVFSSLVIFLEGIVAALLAWAVLGEPVTSIQVVGGAFILAGIYVARPRN